MTVPATDMRWRRWAPGIVLYAVFFWICMLLPLDFRVPGPVGSELHKVWAEVGWSWVEGVRWSVHLALFVPVGVVIRRSLRPRTAGGWAVVAVAVIALAVIGEVAQVFVSRSVSAADAAVNVLGVGLGYASVVVHDRASWMRSITAVAGRSSTLVGLGLILAIAIPVLFRPASHGWDDWDRTYPLLLGNERTADRPWRGELYELAFYDAALTSDEARVLAGADDTETVTTPAEPFLRYDFSAASLVVEERRVRRVRPVAGPPVDLLVHSGEVRALEGGGIRIVEAGVITTDGPPAALYESIVDGGALSIRLRLRVYDLGTTGPARIVSLSWSPFTRNLTIAQEYFVLHLRVRNRVAGDNGVRPALLTDRCLRKDQPQTVVAVCTPSRSELYVDGARRGRMPYRLVDRLIHHVVKNSVQPGMDIGMLALAAVFYVAIYLVVLRRWRPGFAHVELAATVLAAATLFALLAASGWPAS